MILSLVSIFTCIWFCTNSEEKTKRAAAENELDLKKSIIRKMEDNSIDEKNIEKIYETLKQKK